MRENFKKTDNLFHVILFFCGPTDHQELIMKIGHNLLDQIEYENVFGAMFYTDVQTKALGRDVSKAKYKIDLPKFCHSNLQIAEKVVSKRQICTSHQPCCCCDSCQQKVKKSKSIRWASPLTI